MLTHITSASILAIVSWLASKRERDMVSSQFSRRVYNHPIYIDKKLNQIKTYNIMWTFLFFYFIFIFIIISNLANMQ